MNFKNNSQTRSGGRSSFARDSKSDRGERGAGRDSGTRGAGSRNAREAGERKSFSRFPETKSTERRTGSRSYGERSEGRSENRSRSFSTSRSVASPRSGDSRFSDSRAMRGGEARDGGARSFRGGRTEARGPVSRGAPQQRRGKNGLGKKSFNDISIFVNKATKVKEEKPFVPKHKFTDFDLDERLKKNIADAGYITPSQIQDESIPFVLKGRDVVGIANTGTGKTASFVLPLLNRVIANKKEMVMVLAPTRELAVQIDEEFKKFSKGLKVWSVSCVGGLPIYKQIKDLQYDYNFLIGTPGRVKDLIDREKINIKEFTTIVLDESDRMLDMGFVNDMKFLMDNMVKPHNTIFFSATHSRDVDNIIARYLVDPVTISVKTRDTAASIDQDVVHVRGKDKVEVLSELLSSPELEKTIIFGRTKSGVDRLHRDLKNLGHFVESIHGDKRPSERNRALRNFKENNSKVLIATDVAARGLDIPDVSHVINYDLPSTYEDYIHRIGRTGRGGKTGKALTFV